LIDKIIDEGLVGRRVALQQHGYTDDAVFERLREVSAPVRTVIHIVGLAQKETDRLAKLSELAATGSWMPYTTVVKRGYRLSC
jgi:hypothetical protein